MSDSGFEVDVKLASNGDGNVLTPFGIADYKELKAGTTNNKNHVKFEYTIKQNKVSKLTVKVFTKKGVLFQKDFEESMCAVGKHEWQWDGFDTHGILDTKVLKEPLTVEFNAELSSAKKKSSITLNNTHAEEDWLDIFIDKNKKTVAVELRINVKEGRANGVGESPPEEVKNDPIYKRLPVGDARKQRHVRAKGFVNLRALVILGLRRYWSRPITLRNGDFYTVTMNATPATKKAMDDISIVYNTNREFIRSSNPGSVRGIYSLFGNIVPERIAYNVGWIKLIRDGPMRGRQAQIKNSRKHPRMKSATRYFLQMEEMLTPTDTAIHPPS